MAASWSWPRIGTTDVADDRRAIPTGSSGAPGNAARSSRSRQLDPERDPFLAALLPDARNVLVAPMIVESRTVGAIVVEHRARRRTGVERRVAAMLGQFASVAALNLRNAVLLQHVQDLAERDSLTGAANRRMFTLALERIIHGHQVRPRADRVTAVLFLDLDDFKVINDTLGHAAGDELLIAVTERISGLVREGDLVARLGGDEFADPDRGRADAQPRRARWPAGSSTSCARRTSSARSTSS